MSLEDSEPQVRLQKGRAAVKEDDCEHEHSCIPKRTSRGVQIANSGPRIVRSTLRIKAAKPSVSLGLQGSVARLNTRRQRAACTSRCGQYKRFSVWLSLSEHRSTW